MANEFEGACLCGKVQYMVKGPFLRFFLCHCSRCRRSSGSAHGANVFTRAANVTFTAGEDKVKRFDLPDAEQFARAFCTECGSPVPYLSRDKKVYVVAVGGLKDFEGRKVDAMVHWDSRSAWYDGALEAPRKTAADLANS